jgi:hypothetical protein
MTCNELHESSSLRSLAEGGFSADVAAHIEHCSACRQWIEIEEQLSNQLRLLRDDAPTVPATLDESVLKGYRSHMQRAAGDIIPLKPVRSTSGLFWRASIAALLLFVGIIIFGSRKAPSPSVTAKVEPPRIAPATRPEGKTESEPPQPIATKQVATTRVHHRTTVPKTEDDSSEAASHDIRPDFRSLMYCDQLSCSGAMEVIRMNLPASALGMASPSRTSNVVAADVVVGPDGVARAIRIVN